MYYLFIEKVEKKTPCLGHFFGSQSHYWAFMYIKENLGVFSPINLSSVNLILSAARETLDQGKFLLSLPYHSPSGPSHVPYFT